MEENKGLHTPQRRNIYVLFERQEGFTTWAKDPRGPWPVNQHLPEKLGRLHRNLGREWALFVGTFGDGYKNGSKMALTSR